MYKPLEAHQGSMGWKAGLPRIAKITGPATMSAAASPESINGEMHSSRAKGLRLATERSHADPQLTQVLSETGITGILSSCQ